MKAIDFRGSAKEYFGIWITNILLNVATIGIFSAWAKVRRLRYFYNKTKVSGSSFSFHATGWQIFKGRLVALIVVILFAILPSIFALFNLIIPLIILLALPWLLNSSLRFKARMVSYRNIRFNWHGNYWKTFLYFVLGPIISFISLGFLQPLFTRYYYTYYANNHSYGTSRFFADTSVKNFYLGSIRSGLLPSLLIFYCFIMYLIIKVSIVMVDSTSDNLPQEDIFRNFSSYIGEWWGIVFLALIPIIIITNFVYRILARNLLLRALVLNNANDQKISAKFDSNLNPFRYIWIVLSNSIIVTITFGLMSPYAQVRFYKYLSSSTKIDLIGDIEGFLDSEKERLSSLGEEYSEMEGFEVNI